MSSTLTNTFDYTSSSFMTNFHRVASSGKVERVLYENAWLAGMSIDKELLYSRWDGLWKDLADEITTLTRKANAPPEIVQQVRSDMSKVVMKLSKVMREKIDEELFSVALMSNEDEENTSKWTQDSFDDTLKWTQGSSNDDSKWKVGKQVEGGKVQVELERVGKEQVVVVEEEEEKVDDNVVVVDDDDVVDYDTLELIKSGNTIHDDTKFTSSIPTHTTGHRGVVSQDYLGGVSQDYRGVVSQDYRGGVSQDYRGVVSQDYLRGVSQDYRGAVSQVHRGAVSQVHRGAVGQDQKDDNTHPRESTSMRSIINTYEKNEIAISRSKREDIPKTVDEKMTLMERGRTSDIPSFPRHGEEISGTDHGQVSKVERFKYVIFHLPTSLRSSDEKEVQSGSMERSEKEVISKDKSLSVNDEKVKSNVFQPFHRSSISKTVSTEKERDNNKSDIETKVRVNIFDPNSYRDPPKLNIFLPDRSVPCQQPERFSFSEKGKNISRVTQDSESSSKRFIGQDSKSFIPQDPKGVNVSGKISNSGIIPVNNNSTEGYTGTRDIPIVIEKVKKGKDDRLKENGQQVYQDNVEYLRSKYPQIDDDHDLSSLYGSSKDCSTRTDFRLDLDFQSRLSFDQHESIDSDSEESFSRLNENVSVSSVPFEKLSPSYHVTEGFSTQLDIRPMSTDGSSYRLDDHPMPSTKSTLTLDSFESLSNNDKSSCLTSRGGFEKEINTSVETRLDHVGGNGRVTEEFVERGGSGLDDRWKTRGIMSISRLKGRAKDIRDDVDGKRGTREMRENVWREGEMSEIANNIFGSERGQVNGDGKRNHSIGKGEITVEREMDKVRNKRDQVTFQHVNVHRPRGFSHVSDDGFIEAQEDYQVEREGQEDGQDETEFEQSEHEEERMVPRFKSKDKIMERKVGTAENQRRSNERIWKQSKLLEKAFRNMHRFYSDLDAVQDNVGGWQDIALQWSALIRSTLQINSEILATKGRGGGRPWLTNTALGVYQSLLEFVNFYEHYNIPMTRWMQSDTLSGPKKILDFRIKLEWTLGEIARLKANNNWGPRDGRRKGDYNDFV
ncbi:hypothetical protein M231_04064 [Tremella mesenterica]|uniref:Uncharacterized protein n=1 Tax=Tremella mesenterica TaxID=5217 RepID=A0A4V1M402_TREME|nr:hypothetical protein M231_04064 [Tremella mesenterica]